MIQYVISFCTDSVGFGPDHLDVVAALGPVPAAAECRQIVDILFLHPGVDVGRDGEIASSRVLTGNFPRRHLQVGMRRQASDDDDDGGVRLIRGRWRKLSSGDGEGEKE